VIALDESNFLIFGGSGNYYGSYIIETETGEVRETNSQLPTESLFYNNPVVLHGRSNTIYSVSSCYGTNKPLKYEIALEKWTEMEMEEVGEVDDLGDEESGEEEQEEELSD